MKLVLKKMSERAKPASLRYHIHRQLSDFDAHRGVDILHASELTKEDGICPRFFALMDRVGEDVILPDRDKSASEEVTWEFGRMIQDLVVQWFADAGIAVSNWECLNPNCKDRKSLCKRPIECSICGSSKFKPVEPRFKSKKSGASCGIDMLALFPGATLHKVVEIKTIDPTEFKKLVMPLQEHRLRTNLYMRIVHESEEDFRTQIDTSSALVFYVSKGGYGCADADLRKWGLSEYFSPFKEFEVDRNDKATNEMVKRAKVVEDFKQGKVGMPCGLCSTALADRAKKCPARKPCFSGDHPGTYEWQ